jgi:hypothetical protein
MALVSKAPARLSGRSAKTGALLPRLWGCWGGGCGAMVTWHVAMGSWAGCGFVHVLYAEHRILWAAAKSAFSVWRACGQISANGEGSAAEQCRRCGPWCGYKPPTDVSTKHPPPKAPTNFPTKAPTPRSHQMPNVAATKAQGPHQRLHQGPHQGPDQAPYQGTNSGPNSDGPPGASGLRYPSPSPSSAAAYRTPPVKSLASETETNWECSP